MLTTSKRSYIFKAILYSKLKLFLKINFYPNLILFKIKFAYLSNIYFS